jgi:XRE family transcriptional regulator, regulator of sulfur utilization
MPDHLRAVQRRVAGHVERLRRSRGLTQERLAELADISGKHLGEVERGAANATLNTLVAIARALSVDVGELLAPGPRRRRPEPPLFLVNQGELEQLEQVVRRIRSARVTASDDPD